MRLMTSILMAGLLVACGDKDAEDTAAEVVEEAEETEAEDSGESEEGEEESSEEGEE